ncbi:MAG: inner membrane CreD family protein [Rhodomicrobiaceae bacterium]
MHNALWPTLSGVSFFVPIDTYELVNRAAKYGLMFLAVAFFAVLVMELTSGRRVHAVRYVFVGLAMILFYILLLSLAEHTGFTAAIWLPPPRRAACCRFTSANRCEAAQGDSSYLASFLFSTGCYISSCVWRIMRCLREPSPVSSC